MLLVLNITCCHQRFVHPSYAHVHVHLGPHLGDHVQLFSASRSSSFLPQLAFLSFSFGLALLFAFTLSLSLPLPWPLPSFQQSRPLVTPLSAVEASNFTLMSCFSVALSLSLPHRCCGAPVDPNLAIVHEDIVTSSRFLSSGRSRSVCLRQSCKSMSKLCIYRSLRTMIFCEFLSS